MRNDDQIQCESSDDKLFYTRHFSIPSPVFKSAFYVTDPLAEIFDQTTGEKIMYVGNYERDFGGGHTVEMAVYARPGYEKLFTPEIKPKVVLPDGTLMEDSPELHQKLWEKVKVENPNE